jgi:hypothetical protein
MCLLLIHLGAVAFGLIVVDVGEHSLGGHLRPVYAGASHDANGAY